MAKSLFRRGLLALIVFTAALALPLKVAAQASTANRLQTSGPSVTKIELAEVRMTEFPDLPTGRSADSDPAFGRDAYSNAAAMPPTPVIAVSPAASEARPHRFWDRENAMLFSAVGGMAAADFYVTHSNLASGGKELNPITRVLAGSTPALAANFALETSGVMAVSYLFHKTGHHRLERATSLFSIGGSSGAVAYDLAHR